MTEAKLAPNHPGWMVEHANRYLSSGGTDRHMYEMTQPGRPEIAVPSLLLTTTGRKSGERYVFPLFYGKDGDGCIVVASKGGAPQHPGWYRNLLTNSDVEVQVGTAKLKARARTATGEERAALAKSARVLAALRRLSAQDRARDPCGRAGPRPLTSTAPPKPAAARQGHAATSLVKRGPRRRERRHYSRGHGTTPPLLQAGLAAASGISLAHRIVSRSGRISDMPMTPPTSMMTPQIMKPVLKPSSGVAAVSMTLPMT